MPFALTCSCGARLEIDDKFAGQTITCPDCQKPLSAVAATAPGRRTSGLALASLILALAGAFTIVGTLAAVAVGLLALAQIARNSDRLAGRGYAIAGIIIGCQMTAVTLLALIFAGSTLELFGLTGMISSANWAGKLDFNGPEEIVRTREGFAIKKPSEKWGVYKDAPWDRLDMDDHTWHDVLLVLPEEDMVVLCYAETFAPQDIDDCRSKAVRDFKVTNRFGLFHQTPAGRLQPADTVVHDTKRQPVHDKVEIVEMQIDKRVGGEDKSFLMRVCHRDGDGDMFVVIGGVRRSQFGRLQAQLREAMDGFRILDRQDGNE